MTEKIQLNTSSLQHLHCNEDSLFVVLKEFVLCCVDWYFVAWKHSSLWWRPSGHLQHAPCFSFLFFHLVTLITSSSMLRSGSMRYCWKVRLIYFTFIGRNMSFKAAIWSEFMFYLNFSYCYFLAPISTNSPITYESRLTIK